MSLKTNTLLAKAILRYVDEKPEIQEAVREMAQIITAAGSDADDRVMAGHTLRDALFPAEPVDWLDDTEGDTIAEGDTAVDLLRISPWHAGTDVFYAALDGAEHFVDDVVQNFLDNAGSGDELNLNLAVVTKSQAWFESICSDC